MAEPNILIVEDGQALATEIHEALVASWIPAENITTVHDLVSAVKLTVDKLWVGEVIPFTGIVLDGTLTWFGNWGERKTTWFKLLWQAIVEVPEMWAWNEGAFLLYLMRGEWKNQTPLAVMLNSWWARLIRAMSHAAQTLGINPDRIFIPPFLPDRDWWEERPIKNDLETLEAFAKRVQEIAG